LFQGVTRRREILLWEWAAMPCTFALRSVSRN
jgi:hypothetical protein